MSKYDKYFVIFMYLFKIKIKFKINLLIHVFFYIKNIKLDETGSKKFGPVDYNIATPDTEEKRKILLIIQIINIYKFKAHSSKLFI